MGKRSTNAHDLQCKKRQQAVNMTSSLDMSRLEQLKTLRAILASEIDDRPGARDMSQLARQYRETIKEIEEIENQGTGDDEITELLSRREANGKAGAVRKSRSKVQSK